jgi:hypothetical protein
MSLKISPVEIDGLIKRYSSQITSMHRYASFDYCFNYFQKFAKSENINAISSVQNKETSVLQLGYYLASWGMFRGSTAILRHSSHCLIPIIEYISSTPVTLWNIDVTDYSTSFKDMEQLYLNIGEKLKFPIIKEGKQKIQECSPILVTKIMLGVFGNTPAMDDFFMKGIDKGSFSNTNYHKALDKVKDIWKELNQFYNENKTLINSHKIKSLNFEGEHTENVYSKAKVLDMVFFERGNDIVKSRKSKVKID